MLQAQQVLQERYQLKQQLGRTAAGRQTWLATDLESNEQVTLKLLAFSPQMQWEELKLFEREAQVLQALDHSRIPRYRDYFSLDQQTGAGIPWFGLVQDYIPGFSLQELIEQGKRFSEKQVRELATDILKILIYLHELSPPVLHRDIKPSNLILGEDKQIYLVDFGAVQAQAAVTGVTFTVVGTSGYAPLEQFWGRAVAASDLYALGATLIHLLTGTAPADLPQKDSRIQFSDRISLSPYFVGWIENMTNIALEKRYSAARQALTALESKQAKPLATTKNSSFRKIPKPASTRIELNKSAEELEILISPLGLKNINVSAGVSYITLFYTTLVVALSVLATSTISNIWLISLAYLIYVAIHYVILFSETTYVCFNHSYFELERKFLQFTIEKKSQNIKREIAGVFLRKDGENYQVNLRFSSYDKLHCKSYLLGGVLREDESAWLAQEIQDWLNER